jgi:hypothetical protein
MAIIATRTILQALHARIPGIVSAPTVYPVKLNAADLPCVLVFPSAGRWSRPMASSPLFQLRSYRVQLYVKPIVQGQGNDEALQLLDALMQRFGETYCNPDNLILANGQYCTYLRDGDGDVTDSGTTVITFAGVAYHGTQFTLNVKETSA